MYNNMLFGLKRRILDEVESAFINHPAFTDKVIIKNKFPYEKRPQYGVILRNSSASQIRMSADNYLADLWSHCRLAKVDNYPGLSIEWVREDAIHVTELVIQEDVSSQLGTTQRRFYTQYPIMSAKGDTHYADNPGQVFVTINGVPVTPEYVNGRERTVMLSRAPLSSGDLVKISYYRRNIANPGLYLIDFNEDNQFYVTPTGLVTDEIVIDVTNGTETTVSLDNIDVRPGTLSLYLQTLSGDAPFELQMGVDYSVVYSTGVITLLQPLSKNLQLTADYKYDPNISTGPYVVNDYQEVHNAIPGVIISVGRKAKKGDRNLVIISKFREEQARVYGGHWEMSLTLGVLSRDTMQMEEMTDQIVNYLWGVRKNILEFEGITLNRVEPTGESEESYLDLTGDLYYESSVDINVMTEWQEFVPYVFDIRKVLFNRDSAKDNINLPDYTVLDNGVMIDKIQPDTRHVIKYGTTGYERVI